MWNAFFFLKKIIFDALNWVSYNKKRKCFSETIFRQNKILIRLAWKWSYAKIIKKKMFFFIKINFKLLRKIVM